MLHEDAETQVFGDNPTAPGGREWEAECCRKTIGYLEQMLASERARLAFLEGGGA